MKNLKIIALPEIVLYSPHVPEREEIEKRLKNLSNIKYIPNSCEYREKTGKKRSWLFCNSLTYTIDNSGNFITIKYTIGDNTLAHTIITNDIFYIDMSKST